MFLSPTTEREILLIFNNLRSSAPGWDNIALFFIKPIITVILPQLVYILNLSFQQGVDPLEIKIARVKPLFKADNPNLFSNYRHDYQFGFREHHSTSLALTILNHRISSSFENRHFLPTMRKHMRLCKWVTLV